MSAAPSTDKRTLDLSWVYGLAPYLEFALVLVAVALFYSVLGDVWLASPWLRKNKLQPGLDRMILPLALLALSFIARAVRTGRIWNITGLDVALWALLGTGAVAVWAAYDRGTAFALFWVFVAAVGLYYAIAGQPDERHLRVVLGFWGIFGLVFSLAFLATNDWTVVAGKFPGLAAFGANLQAKLPVSDMSAFYNPNSVGSVLAMFLPFYVALLPAKDAQPAWSRIPKILFWLLVAAIVAFGWFLSLSRGAWIALVLAAGAWGVWHLAGWVARRQMPPARVWRRQVGLTLGMLAIGVVLVLVVGALVLSNKLPGGASLRGRLELAKAGLLLVRDYPITGAGLGAFAMQYSIYALLIHVGYVGHAHNMLLDLTIAQGIPGLIAAMAWVTGTFWVGVRTLYRAGGTRCWQTRVTEAALVSLIAILIHGTVDDAFYEGTGFLLLVVPMALVVAASRLGGAVTESSGPRKSRRGRWVALAGGIVVAVLGLWQRQSIAAAWYANLGALAQARVELSTYNPEYFAELNLDQVRRWVNLDDEIELLTRAAELDPGNATAQLRLTSICLARGNYEAALQHMQAAWAAGHRDSATRLLYGDALVAAGQAQEAATVVQGLDWAEARLEGEAWDRYWLGEDYRRAADAWATVLLLDPENANADYWHKESLAKLN